MIKSSALGLAVALMSVPPALAGQIYESDLTMSDASAGLPSGKLGWITIQQNGYNEVDLTLNLASGVQFANTGGPHHSFVFNLDTGILENSTVAMLSPTGGVFSVLTSSVTNAPFGTFTSGVDCSTCGDGTSPPVISGSIELKVTNTDGISIDNLVKNSGGDFFAADIGIMDNTRAFSSVYWGKTGDIAGGQPFLLSGGGNPLLVPEPATSALLGSVSVLFGLVRRRRVK